MPRYDDRQALQSFPLSQIKMIGFLQQGLRHAALLFLPNNSLIMVEAGAVVGKERGIIMTISNHYLELLFPDKQKKILTLKK
jgi:Tfp pilus assembly protein PilP